MTLVAEASAVEAERFDLAAEVSMMIAVVTDVVTAAAAEESVALVVDWLACFQADSQQNLSISAEHCSWSL